MWLKIHSAEAATDTPHRVDLELGPWMRTVVMTVPASGMVLRTGKARDTDGIARTCNISCDKKIFLLYGAGSDLFDEPNIIDIRRGWRIAPGEHA